LLFKMDEAFGAGGVSARMSQWVGELYREHKDRVYSFIRGMVGDSHAAEDLTQETFARAVAAAEGFEARALPSTWVFAIARNLALNYLEAAGKRRHVGADMLQDRAARDCRPEVKAERDETAGEIREAVRALSAEHREVFLLKVVEGLTYREIAQVLGCPTGTAQSRFFHAVRELRKRLSAQGADHGL